MYSLKMVTKWPDWLADFMAKKDLNNKGLAIKLEIAQSTVGNWLNGEKPKSEMIIKLATLAGDDPADLFSVVNGLFVLRGEQELTGSITKSTTVVETERYLDILEELEFISDDGLDLLKAQIRHVLRDRYPRAGNTAHHLEGGGESDGSEQGKADEQGTPDNSNSR